MIEPVIASEISKPLSRDDLDWSILSKDKSTFIMLSILRKKDEHDLAQLSQEIPEPLHNLFDELLSFLEKNKLIELTETKLRLTNKDHLNFSIELAKSFFPSLARLAAEVSLRNFSERRPGTSFYMQAVARTPRNLAYLKEIDKFLVNKFNQMSAEKADSEDFSCQLICYTNCQIKMEDAL